MERVENLRPYSVPCHDYMDEKSERKTVSAIIVPIGFQRRSEKIIISWACSKGLTCYNSTCRYSKTSKLFKYIEEGETSET